jgi:phosphoserine phosphatase RsbU/P
MEDGSLLLVVADVMGHGFGPALLAATIHACLRAFSGTSADTQTIMARLNQLLCQKTDDGRFVTLILVRVDPRTLTLRYANAGHPPGYIISSAGRVKAALESGSLPLGLDPEADFPVSEPIALEPDDVLLMMTDGIVETSSPDGEQFGAGRTLEIISANPRLSARELIELIRARTTEFATHSAPPDDLTAVVLKVGPSPQPPVSF